jgi:integrase/recombinase XerC
VSKHDAPTPDNFRRWLGDVEDALTACLRSFARHLRAQNKARATIRGYVGAGKLLADWLRASADRPDDFAEVTHEHLTEFFSDLFDRGHTPASVANRSRSLQQFYRWLREVEEEIDRSPFDRLKCPTVPEQQVPVVPDEDLKKLLATCKTKSFVDLRDEALIRILVDCGLRRAECAGINVDDLDMDCDDLGVTGKGRRSRRVPFGAKAGRALDRYLRARARHRLAHLPDLWLAQKGPLTADGIHHMVQRRCRLAGIPYIHPHQLRHTSADMAFAAGMSEGDAMRLFGWKSRQMCDRYGAAQADRRAHASKRRLSPADEI